MTYYSTNYRLLGISSLLCLSQPALAQQAEPAPLPSAGWSVGLQAATQLRVYNIDRMGTGRFVRTLGMHAGYSVSPRLTAQFGLEYGRSAKPDEERVGSGQFAYYPQTAQITRAWAVPVALRWPLAQNPHRFQVEGILGATLSAFTLRETGDNSATGTKWVAVHQGLNGFVDLGIGGRLRCTPHLSLATDLLISTNVIRPINYYLPFVPGAGVRLGVDYRLN